MNLPRGKHAQVERAKIIDYLLSIDHPDGRSKAAFFYQFGFSPAKWQILADALIAVGESNPVVSKRETRYGTQYVVDGALPTSSGRTPVVRTIWIIDHEDADPRLVTAYPSLGERV